MNDPIIDLIIRIKNAYMTRNESLTSTHSAYRIEVLKKLKDLGFVKDFTVSGEIKKKIDIKLQYHDGVAALTGVRIASTPGKREYVGVTELKPIVSGMGYAFLSTSKGIMTNKEAKKAKIGGELLFEIW